jgi:hypothetical protein
MFVAPNIGDLRCRVTIESISAEPKDRFGQVSQVWDIAGGRWAKIDDKKGEGLSVNQANTRTQLGHVEITFRYFPGLTVNHRVRYGPMRETTLTAKQLIGLTAAEYAALSGNAGDPPKVYKIVAIDNPDKRREWQVVDAVEVTTP